ncbi:MAG: tRNA preQ1(34) S-adenosylmethionine ribosyltransferase-isomerase QueA [Deltaproteobacteria bacterium]|nr:tRNA preQ1(34) S-adenosylmethionine ribosyltransferase-isomerase QueA [Deltaproteobacteria bacterium]
MNSGEWLNQKKHQNNDVLDIPREFRLSTYSYDLPSELVANAPAPHRDHSRLLIIDRNRKKLEHHIFFELPDFLDGSDVLVINETQVIPAALKGHKVTGGIVQLLVLNPASVGHQADPAGPAYRFCLAKTSKRLRVGTVIQLSDGVELVVDKTVSPAKVLIKFPVQESEFLNFLEKFGLPPLPPYIKQDYNDQISDRQRYQTVYSRVPGSIAAPTAGLHFTTETFDNLGRKGIQVIKITLHVGPGTFMPIRNEDIRLHKMEPETYCVPEPTARFLRECLESKRRIIAVGSTCVRALEASYDTDKGFISGIRTTDLFITPGYKFKVVKGMITNFHLPASTLLTLVCAIGGVDTMLNAYRIAISDSYRFYSYGDACLII